MKKTLVLLVAFLLCTLLFCGCGPDSSYNQRETLERAYEKSQNGAPLTKQEERELESFKKWEKEYDAQQYNEKYY